jgi:hypothetical protein
MPNPLPELPLCPGDLDNLRASGLTDETIRAAGLRTENNALVFPYRDLDGKQNGFARRRPHNPRVIDGRVAKYIQPTGSPLRAYFPPASLAGLRDGVSPVYVTEGEKKALALSQLGLPAVGLGGVWCGCKKGTDDLIEDITYIVLSGRIFYIVFDYDPKENTRDDVTAAARRLERALRSVGAGGVYVVELPPGPNGAKQGVDDYLVSHSPFEFGELVGRAAAGITGIKIISCSEIGPDAYHGFVSEFLRAVAPFTEATDAGVLAHLLPALGALVGPRCYVWAGGTTRGSTPRSSARPRPAARAPHSPPSIR